MRKLLLDALDVEEIPPLCQRIREAREQAGLSQEEAARRLSLTLGGYAPYERYREPKPRRAREIAVAFGLPKNYFERNHTSDNDRLDELERLARGTRDRVDLILRHLGVEPPPDE